MEWGGRGRTARVACRGWETVSVKSRTVEMIEKNSSGSLVQGVFAWVPHSKSSPAAI